MRIGANYLGQGRCEFAVWAPSSNKVVLKIVHPAGRLIPMVKDENGYWHATVDDIFPGARYLYVLESGHERPDPASYFQSEGVHGPSEVIDHSSFAWQDGTWRSASLKETVFYELHVGTFTPEGTFEAVIGKLDELIDLGITAIELMPVAQFPGDRNWGYDGAYSFAVQNSYGGPDGLKTLVNACHKRGMSVFLDVVYNHFGPEGNYSREFAPYFTDRYKTPWGDAINFDGPDNHGVRDFFVENALYWFREYHIDGLRLDAIHGIYDMSKEHILKQLSESASAFSGKAGRKFYLIAESDLNQAKIVRPVKDGGYGIDAQWCDDFHHSLHVLLTGQRDGYYADFDGVKDIEKAMTEGFVYGDRHSVFRGRKHGDTSKDVPADKLVAFSQNHDQIGNRAFGERMSALADLEALKLSAGSVFLSPYIPLIFMGEECAEDAPFLYFVSHGDRDLITAVREGRKREFASFKWAEEPPDPQSAKTFLDSKIRWKDRHEGRHRVMLDLYKELIRMRKSVPALSDLDKKNLSVKSYDKEKAIFIKRHFKDSEIFCILNFNHEGVDIAAPLDRGRWKKLLDSSEKRWMGPGSTIPDILEGEPVLAVRPLSFLLFEKNKGE